MTNHTVARLSVSLPYSVCSKFSNYAFDNISSPSSNTFFSVTALLEYSDKGLNHDFFSCRRILPSKFHWFRSLPSQSLDSLNFPKKCCHNCCSSGFKLIFLRNPVSLSYIRISTSKFYTCRAIFLLKSVVSILAAESWESEKSLIWCCFWSLQIQTHTSQLQVRFLPWIVQSTILYFQRRSWIKRYAFWCLHQILGLP